MTRSRLSSSLVLCGLVTLGSTACSFSFKAGSSSSTEAGKPAHAHDDHEHGAAPSSKPIAKADPAPADPAPAETEPETEPETAEPGADDPGPSRVPPSSDEPPPVVEPQLTAVCRVADETLAALCHRAFDPIAADDLDGWTPQLAAGAVLTRPAHREGMQRLRGAEAIGRLASDAGGLRSLLHLRPTDRLVVTVSNDCRRCRRSFVAFEANTRSGTVTVTFEMTQPPSITSVEVGAQVRRQHLGQARERHQAKEPAPAPTAPPEPAPTAPPKKDPTPTVKTPSAEIVAPTKPAEPPASGSEQ